jgi:ATP adenylyltransferase
MNVGRTAGAGFDKHLHIHVVPRWDGDTNFMPVICNEDVISESLESVYNKLRIK